MSYSSIIFESDLYKVRIPYCEIVRSYINKEAPVYYYIAFYQLKYPTTKTPHESFNDDMLTYLLWEKDLSFYGLYVFMSVDQKRIDRVKLLLSEDSGSDNYRMIHERNFRYRLTDIKTHPSWAIFYTRIHNELLSPYLR